MAGGCGALQKAPRCYDPVVERVFGKKGRYAPEPILKKIPSEDPNAKDNQLKDKKKAVSC